MVLPQSAAIRAYNLAMTAIRQLAEFSRVNGYAYQERVQSLRSECGKDYGIMLLLEIPHRKQGETLKQFQARTAAIGSELNHYRLQFLKYRQIALNLSSLIESETLQSSQVGSRPQENAWMSDDLSACMTTRYSGFPTRAF